MNHLVGTRQRAMYQHIGNRIRELRELHGWSGEHLTELLGYNSRATLSHYETAKRKISAHDLYRLALLFDVTIDSFFPDRKIR